MAAMLLLHLLDNGFTCLHIHTIRISCRDRAAFSIRVYNFALLISLFHARIIETYTYSYTLYTVFVQRSSRCMACIYMRCDSSVFAIVIIA